jgi:hypothetical protein
MEKKSRWNDRVERAESFWMSLVNKRWERIHKSMTRPLYQEALKSLFFVGILIVDALLPLEIWRDIIFPLNIAGALIILCVLLYIEIWIYERTWGKNGRWSLEQYKKNSFKEKK